MYQRIDEPYKKLNDYYNTLENKQKIFYMYFTSGMLMFLMESIGYLRENENIILLASALDEDEIVFINKNIKFRFFYLGDDYLHDREVWHLLFSINRFHFGWIDVDCFIKTPHLIDEMSKIDDDCAMNGYSSILAWPQVHILRTYFVFINIDIVKELNVSPYMYRYDFQEEDGRGAFIVPQEDIELLEKRIPIGSYYSNLDHFDTTVYYQVMALCKHYKLYNLHGFHDEISYDREVFHLGRSCLISMLKNNRISQSYIDNSAYNMIILHVAKNLIEKYKEELPDIYHSIYNELTWQSKRLIASGVDIEKVIKLVKLKWNIEDIVWIDEIMK